MKKTNRSSLRSPAPATCTGGTTLSGWYGFIVGGSLNAGGGEYLTGAVYFDGNCGLSGAHLNGSIGSQSVGTSVSGSYGQNSDGTVNLTMNVAGEATAQTYIVGVSESGNKARGIESDGSAVANIEIQSQYTSLNQGYSTANLSGSYGASCTGAGVGLDYLVFDGKGKVSGVSRYHNGGTEIDTPYSGTYSVNGDGTFSGNFVAGSYAFTGVIDNGVSEVQYTYGQVGGMVACSGKQSTTTNLLGYYGIVIGNPPNRQNGKYLSGSVYFDGAGNLTATNLNGGISGTYSNTNAIGSYAVNGDNTIAVTMSVAGESIPQTYVVAVSEAGNEAVGIETDGSAVASIDMQSQLQLPSTPYSAASLQGTYAAYCSGEEVDVNYVTFDGNGNLFGVDPYDDGNYGNNPYTGYYSVNVDGTFSGGFGGSYTWYTMTGVIDNGNAEIEYTYNLAGSGGVVSCVGESTYGPIGANPVLASPSFRQAPGAYSSPQTVALTDTTPGALIYYTTNATTPTTNSSVYSGPFTVSATTTVQAITVAPGYNNSAIASATYMISSAAYGAVVNLASYYNAYGIATVGNAPKGGGLDANRYEYNSSTLGTAVTYQGLTFPLGPANVRDALYTKTIPAPAGQYNQLYLLGTAVHGTPLTNQVVIVTYTDGTKSKFVQSFSDWTSPQYFQGETLVAQPANRINAKGQIDSRAVGLYGYTFSLVPGKAPANVKLPGSRYVVFLGVGWGEQAH